MAGVVVYDSEGTPVTSELLLRAYRARCFPMGDDRRDRLSWYRPSDRAIISWDRFTVPRSLRKTMKREPYAITFDRAFAEVISACADRSETWICHDIEALYVGLHEEGIAHSVEAWDDTGALVGGLYGLCLGAVFCGESMFHRASDAAKICVVHLIDHLKECGFALLDCQQQSEHMARFGAYMISDEDYAALLEKYDQPCRF